MVRAYPMVAESRRRQWWAHSHVPWHHKDERCWCGMILFAIRASIQKIPHSIHRTKFKNASEMFIPRQFDGKTSIYHRNKSHAKIWSKHSRPLKKGTSLGHRKSSVKSYQIRSTDGASQDEAESCTPHTLPVTFTAVGKRCRDILRNSMQSSKFQSKS